MDGRSRIVFMGSDPIALPMLAFLADSGGGREQAELVGVFTQPDRAKGRGKAVQPNVIKTWARALGVPVLQPEKPDAETVEWLRAQQVDLVIVMAYGHLLRKALLAAPRYGTVNFHASLLPRYRGASPIETAIAEGEPETGVSLMRIVPKMDAGPVADTARVPITQQDNGDTLRHKLSEGCVTLLSRNLHALLTGTLEFTPQNEREVSYCRRLIKRDGALDFALPARTLADRIRAFRTWPGSHFEHEGNPIKVGNATWVPDGISDGQPGEVLDASASGVVVNTASGSLVLTELQRPGGKMLPAKDFLNGYPLPGGTVLPSLPNQPLVSDRPFQPQAASA